MQLQHHQLASTDIRNIYSSPSRKALDSKQYNIRIAQAYSIADFHFYYSNAVASLEKILFTKPFDHNAFSWTQQGSSHLRQDPRKAKGCAVKNWTTF